MPSISTIGSCTLGCLHRIARAIAVAIDQYFSKVVFLTHLDGVNGGTSATDSTARHALTFNGNAALTTSQKMFGTASASFSGATMSNITAPASADFQFGASDFTVEGWLYSNSVSQNQYQVILGNWSNASNSRSWLFESDFTAGNTFSTLTFYMSSTGTSITQSFPVGNISPATWYHFAVSRVGNTLYLFLNGVPALSRDITGVTLFNSTAPLYIGGFEVNSPYNFPGYLDDLRITLGQGRYTSAFTPPSAPFPDPGLFDTQFSNVTLLAKYEGINGSTAMVNSATAGTSMTSTGVTIDTSLAKFGASSSLFGAGNYITLGSTTPFGFGAGDFTVEAWVNPTTTGQMLIMGNLDDSTGHGSWFWFMNYAGASPATLLFAYNTNNSGSGIAIRSTTTAALPINTWSHVAVVRSGAATYLFVNGVSQGTNGNIAGTLYDFTTIPFRIGKETISSSGQNQFTGHMDELRVTKGTARYTTAFTPSTQSFPTK